MPPHTASGNSASTLAVNERIVSRSRSRTSTDFLKLHGQNDGHDIAKHRRSDTEESSLEDLVIFRGGERGMRDQIQSEETNTNVSSVVYAPKPLSPPLGPILNTRRTEAHYHNTAAITYNQSRPATTDPQTLPTANNFRSSGVRNCENDDERQFSYRSQSSRPISPSKRFSSPRPFLLPRTPKRADLRLTLVGDTSRNLDTQDIYSDELLPDRPYTPTPLSPENTYCFRTPSPRLSARRRRWRPGSPRPDYVPTNLVCSVMPPVTLDEGKLWKVFNEDEDLPIAKEQSNHIPLPTTLRPCISIQHVSPRYPTSGHIVCGGASPSSTTSPIRAGIMDFPLSNPRDYSKNNVKPQITEVYNIFIRVFSDPAKYKQFLSHKGDIAQYLLNLLQKLLYHFKLSGRCRTKFLQGLLRLSRKSELVPDGLFLSNVQVESEGPITDGHFGEIYKGQFRSKPVCLKVVKMYQRSDQHVLLKAFLREAVLWSQLSHINVLPFIGIYQIRDKRDRIGLVSPWMDNGDINEYLRRCPEANRQLLVSDIAAGILYLHSNGVIHGDLKGGNILVTTSCRACLADFGLSSVVDSQGMKIPALSSGDPKGGTVRFQAPELNDPDVVNPKSQASDIYAFALVCYEIFTGNYPFPHIPNHWAVIMKVIEGERPVRPIGSLYDSRGLTDRMWALMEDCWAHESSQRPTASEIVQKGLLHQRDPRPLDNWGDQFSHFRALIDEEQYETQEVPVAETLRTLETIGISSFGI